MHRVLVAENDRLMITWLLKGGDSYTQVICKPPDETIKARKLDEKDKSVSDS